LDEHYSIALEQATNWINDNFKPIGIVVSGSIIRGNPDTRSDFDIFVIHEESFRQRVQKIFNDVPCEIFVNNPSHIYGYFENELKVNRPVAASMLSTGKIIKGEDNPVIRQLIEDAKEYAVKTPARTVQQNTASRYEIATIFEDASDLLDTDEIAAAYFLERTILLCIDFAFLVNGQPLPRAKERINKLAILRPALGNLIKQYYQQENIDKKYRVAKQIVDKLVGHTGFFEWRSKPE